MTRLRVAAPNPAFALTEQRLSGCARFAPLAFTGSGLHRRNARARSLRSSRRVCHSALPLSALPVTGAGRAFLPRQGLAVFRHSRVSEKRSQTLNSLGGKTSWLTRNPLQKFGSVASRRDLAQWNPGATEAQRHLLASLQGRRSMEEYAELRTQRSVGACESGPIRPTRGLFEIPQVENQEVQDES